MSAAGESVLGDLVADAQRAAVHADIALTNAGGLRADLAPGAITWGDILTVHPFSNRILALHMTGAQLLRALEEQWPADPAAIPQILKTSGLYYQWDPARPHRFARGARLRCAAAAAAHRGAVPGRRQRLSGGRR